MVIITNNFRRDNLKIKALLTRKNTQGTLNAKYKIFNTQ